MPHIQFNFAALLLKVDVFVHHGRWPSDSLIGRTLTCLITGGAGSTMKALNAGVPQGLIATPMTCPDQVFHGSKVARLGCGLHLKPRFDLRNEYEDVSTAIQDITSSLPAWKAKCRNTKGALAGAQSGDAHSSFATEILQRWSS